jgi:cell division protein FtsL
MEQQSNPTIARYRKRAEQYRQQRNITTIIALLIILVLFVAHQFVFYQQLNNLNRLEKVVESYRNRCDAYQEQVVDLIDKIQMLEYENSKLQKKTKEIKEAKETKVLFVPNDWTLSTGKSAKIYKSVPLDKNLQEYTWQLCEYLDVPECYETCLAIMWQETHYDSTLVSGTNDYGLMQVNECNINSLHDKLGITDIMAVDQNICSGVYLFTLNYRQFGSTNEALMAYNIGPSATEDCLANGIYSTGYSRSVISKTQMILQDEYDPAIV